MNRFSRKLMTLAAGTLCVLTIAISSAPFFSPAANASRAVAAPSITSTSGTTIVGKAKKIQIKVTGYPAPTLTESGSLPSGVHLVGSSGKWYFTGTPAAGTGALYTITLTATNSQGSVTVAYALTVTQLPAFPATFCPTGLQVGKYFHKVVAVASWPPFFGLTSTATLPAGLTFTQLTTIDHGVISGTPTSEAAGKYAMSFSADNSNSSATKHQRCKGVIKQAPSFSSANHATLSVGTKLSSSLSIGGSSGYPVKPLVSMTGTLPTGISQSSKSSKTFALLLKGKPGTGSAGVYPLTVKATNGVGSGAKEKFILIVRTQSVAPSATTLTLSATPTTIAYGGTITFHASVSGSGTPGGFVQFEITGALSPTTVALTHGSASFTTPSTLAAGNYTIKATYTGDVHHLASTTTKSFTVTAATTTLTLSPSSAKGAYGASTQFVATVSSTNGYTPQGQVTFTIGGTPTISFLNATGKATFTTPTTLVASSDPYALKASFSPYSDAPLNWGRSTATATFNVNPTELSVTVADDNGSSTLTTGTTVAVTRSLANEICVSEASGVSGGPIPSLAVTLQFTVGGVDKVPLLEIPATITTVAPDAKTSKDDYFWTIPSGDLTKIGTHGTATVTISTAATASAGSGSFSFTLTW